MEESASFFEPPYLNFFRPLAGKYRDAAVRCLRALYLRLNGPEADYEYHHTRADVVECFAVALREAAAIDADGQVSESRLSADGVQRGAGEMLRALCDAGWIEKYSDPSSMRSAFRFTPRGRQFAANFARDADDIVTQTQNTRSTVAHLRTFREAARRGRISVPDLMIAAKLSSDIVGDFNEIIEEVAERKRQFAESASRDLERARRAGEEFFDYMSRRFVPDLHVRFNEDSVERYRSQINECLTAIRALPDTMLQRIEKQLRYYYPGLLRDDRPSLLLWVLGQIGNHINRACDAKLPELRRETRAFVRRADALLHHLAAITYEGNELSAGQHVARLSKFPPAVVDRVLRDPRSQLPPLRVRLVDPGTVRLRARPKRAPIDDTLPAESDPTPEALLEREVRRELARLFRVDAESISDYVIGQLGRGRRVRLSEMNITDMPSLLAALHAGQAAGTGRGTPFRIAPLGDRVSHELFESDDYLIEYRPESARRRTCS